jgi:glycosyltransferase involved in cell wall biosynthesis
VSISVRELRERTKSRFNQLLADLGEVIKDGPAAATANDAGDLLSPHQKWVLHERVDLQGILDLSRRRDQARFVKWWVHRVPAEYSAADESVGWGHLSSPHQPAAGPFATLITNLMQMTNWMHEDGSQFDVGTRHGRILFIDWFYRTGLFDEELDGTPYVHHILAELTAPASAEESRLPINKFAAFVSRMYRSEFGASEIKVFEKFEEAFVPVLNRCAPELLYLYNLMPDGVRPVNRNLSLRSATERLGEGSNARRDLKEGVNMIGYAHGAFGMGEHVRMSARALSLWTNKFSIIDVDSYAHARQPELDISDWVARTERYATNIFHVNADVLAGTMTTIGPSQGADRYNIGYWAWELSLIPEAWRPSIDFVDEIWAPSRFIQDAFQAATDKAVIYMPLCVDLTFDSWHRRSHFGLPDGKFLFLYYFDSYSYFQRKNPFAALRAFKEAFPNRSDVGLVIKTQNANAHSPEWLELLEMTNGDPRIHILNRVMSKSEVMSLQAECDCFVSLHRSEGFGRGPAEALWLGKPVICTAYSGNMDFTTSENSLLVDYELIPVQATEYPFHRKQVWAQPDELHAARQMLRLVVEAGLARTLGRNGAALMRDEFSPKAIGKRYADRLRQLGAL